MNNLLKGNGKKQLSKLESIEIIYTAQKLKLSIKDLFSKFDQFPADLDTFSEELHNRKLHFLYSMLLRK